MKIWCALALYRSSNGKSIGDRGKLTENVLGAGCSDDDLGAHGSDPDLDAGVSILRELSGEHLVELGVEDAIGYELPLLADLSSGCHFLDGELACCRGTEI